MQNAWIRDMVLNHHRRDILANLVLGYEVQPHHLRIMRHQHRWRKSMVLVWRGAGKSTVGTIVECIFQILLDRNRRILLASKTGGNAEGFLAEIKGHFEKNERLREIFGDYVGTEQWGNDAIIVLGRTKPFKEPTINTVGIGGAVASKHYDIIIADDLVDEENSRTKHQREKMLDWWYKVLMPTLEPPIDPKRYKKPGDRFIGGLKVIGTRYHYEDLYGHLITRQSDGTGGELVGAPTLIIPIEDNDGNPVWPEKFSKEHIEELRSGGIIRFNSQYMCDCDAMKGVIFQYDSCVVVKPEEMPDLETLLIYQGVDLAISEETENDMFAQVVIGIDSSPAKLVYVLHYEEKQIRFAQQTKRILAVGRQWKALRTGIEANAYQAAQVHQVEDFQAQEGAGEHQLNVVPIYTLKDKITRGQKLQAKLFEAGRIRFLPGQSKLIEHLVLFPNHRLKDLFDALDIAVSTAEKRKRKARDREPGVM